MKEVVTESYNWQYETCGKNNEIGIISKAHYKQRVRAIAEGEYKAQGDDPRTWLAKWPERGAWPTT